jgi:BASS family bile acid:Na+ symporter
MKQVMELAVPGLVCGVMFVVGLGLTPRDFRQVLRAPWLVAVAFAGQAFLLPLLVLGAIQLLDLSPIVEKGLLLIAICPAGSMANVYCQVARANVALSVTVTAASCLLSIATLPAWTAALDYYLGATKPFTVPVTTMIAQLGLTVLVPILVGMAARQRWPGFAERNRGRLVGFSLLALAILIGAVISQEQSSFASGLGELLVVAAIFCGAAFLVGGAVGLLAGGGGAEFFAVGSVFVARNLLIAAALAVSVLGEGDFAVFGTAYFLCQAPLLVIVALAFRRRLAGEAQPAETSALGLPGSAGSLPPAQLPRAMTHALPSTLRTREPAQG